MLTTAAFVLLNVVLLVGKLPTQVTLLSKRAVNLIIYCVFKIALVARDISLHFAGTFRLYLSELVVLCNCVVWSRGRAVICVPFIHLVDQI